MKFSLPYLIFGLLLMGAAEQAARRGWLASPATELRNVPRSIRENPGVYRSHYHWLPRWFGGK